MVVVRKANPPAFATISTNGAAIGDLRLLPLLLSLFAAFCPAAGLCQSSITTQRYDNARTGQNLSETILNESNVNPATFGKLFTRAVDDQVYAQPLYIPNVTVPNVGNRNILYVATVNNSVYAFDADDPGAAEPLWRVSLTVAESGARPVNASDVGHNCGTYRDYAGNIGIVGTPTIDETRRTLYVIARSARKNWPPIAAATRRLYVAARTMTTVAKRMETDEFADWLHSLVGNADRPVIYATTGTLWFVARRLDSIARALNSTRFVQQLHALDIATGAERPNSPVVIKARAHGTGAGSWFGVLLFDPEIHNQRGSLLLANDIVYITWASHCETGPHHGWIMGYDPTTLSQVLAKTVTPSGKGGGIWQSNAGPSADASGNLYLTVGNGTVTAPDGGQDYGNAFLKLNSSGEILDWFIPYNFEALNKTDRDVGSAGVLLIPHTNLLTSGGKEGKLYLLDRNNFGHFQQGSDNQIVQSFLLEGDLRGTPTYWDGPGGPYIYVWCSDCRGQAYGLRGDLLTTTPISVTTMESIRGGILSISAKGTTAGTGILWANTGALRAFDASDLSHELWNSERNASRDNFGNFAKFNTPVVAQGKVYLATFSKQVAVFGLLPQGDAPPIVGAGDDQRIRLPNKATIVGTAIDDGLPSSPGVLATTWVQVDGPKPVAFSNPHSLSTTVTFSSPGTYVLRLTASDGALAADSNVTIEVLSQR